MKLPRRTDDLIKFAKDTIDECMVSRESRRGLYRALTSMYFTGSDDGSPAKRNLAFEHVDKMSSYLFSPVEVRFTLDFEGKERPEWKKKAEAGSRYLNRYFSRGKVGTAFAEANEWALVKGCTILRVNWGSEGFEPWVIQPEFFGVLREDINDLDRQDAFCATSFVTETALKRILAGRSDKDDILRSVAGAFDAQAVSETEDFGPVVSMGGAYPNVPISIPGISTPSPASTGSVNILGYQPSAMLAPEVASRLIRLEELWVWDDEREDYTTIVYAEPGILLEGRYKRQNLTGVKGEHPYRRVCSNEVPNYFWGRSDIANLAQLQKMLNGRIENIDAIYRLKANPARSFRGFSGLSEDKAKALLSPGGMLMDGNPAGTTAVDTYSPDVPQGYREYIGDIERWAQEAGGFTPILSGQGEPGVRAGVHADTLLRTSTPRLRDRALLIEGQCADAGDLCWKLLAAKDPTVLGSGKDEFTLAQLPDDVSVLVDSHTSSPAFSGEAEQKVMGLFKAGVIGPEELIRGMHLPMEEDLIASAREREAAHSKEMAELRQQDPDEWAKAVAGHRRR